MGVWGFGDGMKRVLKRISVVQMGVGCGCFDEDIKEFFFFAFMTQFPRGKKNKVKSDDFFLLENKRGEIYVQKEKLKR